MNNEALTLEQGIQELGYSAAPSQIEALFKYLEILDTTNRSFNLTRIAREEYVTLHLLDSLTALACMPQTPHPRIIDIGTGAGFPGVPLAALLPEAHVTLLDSTAKKVRFAEETAHQCGITNCRGIHARAEALAKDNQHRERYDVVVSRAVASFATLIQLMLPLVRPGGRAIALKGAKAEEELSGTETIVRSLRGKPARVETITLPGTAIARQLIVVEKIAR
jgi:16S rRNA (guanine527-N7)-methyltransferase